MRGDIDVALEICENELLPAEVKFQTTGTLLEWKHMSQRQLWEHFICLYNEDHLKKLLPLSVYLEIVRLEKDALWRTRNFRTSATSQS